MTETLKSLFWKLQAIDRPDIDSPIASEIQKVLGLSMKPDLESLDCAFTDLESLLGSVPDKWDFDLGWGWRCDVGLDKANMFLDWRERRYGKADWFEVVEASAATPALVIYACICGAKAQLDAHQDGPQLVQLPSSVCEATEEAPK